MTTQTRIGGVIPAALTPFDEDGRIHPGDLRAHLEYLAGTAGVTGITVNGHAGEVSSLSPAEQQQVLEAARQAVGEDQWLVAGVYAHSTAEACDQARRAADSGADALLVFPPEIWEFGLAEDPRLAYGYYAAISEAAPLPIVAFVYPTFSPFHLPTAHLIELCEAVPSIVAVKEWSNDAVVYEETFRRLRAEHPRVSLLSSYSRSLLASLAIGADGILSGHGSLIPELQCAIWRAAAADDLAGARETAAVLHELTRVFYAAPTADGFTRMKYAALRLGRISTGTVRGPLLPLRESAREQVEAVLPVLRRFAEDVEAAGMGAHR
jgi:4-hydroxy-tetrahydrodipicolinate synthase